MKKLFLIICKLFGHKLRPVPRAIEGQPTELEQCRRCLEVFSLMNMPFEEKERKAYCSRITKNYLLKFAVCFFGLIAVVFLFFDDTSESPRIEKIPMPDASNAVCGWEFNSMWKGEAVLSLSGRIVYRPRWMIYLKIRFVSAPIISIESDSEPDDADIFEAMKQECAEKRKAQALREEKERKDEERGERINELIK